MSAILLGVLLSISSASASSVKDISFNGSQLDHQISLNGVKTGTIYEDEEYETTCSREEPYTAYRTECDYRTVQSCHTEGGGESCTSSPPSCTDTTRQVCNSNGCVDVPTRECTGGGETCHTNPSREVCTDHQESYNCHDVAYTAYQTITYSCTQTRSVPVGTVVVEELSADLNLRFTGDFRGITGRDSFRVSLADGNDLSRPDLMVESTASADTHFFKLTKIFEEKTPVGVKKHSIRAAYQIEVIPYATILANKTTITSIDATRGTLKYGISQALDDSALMTVLIKKDRFLGGLVEVYEKTIKGTAVNGKLDLDVCLNKRPHEFKLTLTRDVSKLLGGTILNSSAVKKAQKALVSTSTKRIKPKGGKNGQCSNEHRDGQKE